MVSTVTSRFAGPSDTLTIASGSITPTRSNQLVDTEAAAASDDLDTIVATNFSDGDMLVLRAADSARTVVVKNGTGNIHIPADFSLTHVRDTITLMYSSVDSAWLGVSSSNNGA